METNIKTFKEKNEVNLLELEKYLKEKRKLPGKDFPKLRSFCYRCMKISPDIITSLVEKYNISPQRITPTPQEYWDRFENFIKINKRLPSSVTKNEEELWAYDFYHVRSSSTKWRARIDEILNKYGLQRRDFKRLGYEKQITRLKEFLDKYNRYPSTYLPGTKEIDREGCAILSFIRGVNKSGDKRKIEELEKVLSPYPHNSKAPFIKKLRLFEDFIKTNKRMPSKTSKDPEEKLLGYFWRNRERNLHPEMLEAVVEKYGVRETKMIQKTPGTSFDKSLLKFEQFISKTRRMPRYGVDGEDELIKVYYYAQNKTGENGVEYRNRIRKLLDKYSIEVINLFDKRFEDNLNNLEKFLIENKRRPQFCEDKTENSLKCFIQNILYAKHKTNYEEKRARIRNLFLKYIPNEPAERQKGTPFKERLLILQKFCRKNNRLPDPNIPEEVGLYNFIHLSRNRRNLEICKLIEEYKRKPVSIEIQNFYNQYGRFPKESSLIEEEKVLGEKLVRDPDKALNGVKVTLAPIVYQDFEQFTMAQQCEVLSILGLPQNFIYEACEGGKKKTTIETLKKVFKNHGAELVGPKDQKESKSITEIGRIKRFSVVMAEYKADPHSPYLINESLNGLWDTIITESKHNNMSTYNELISDTEQTEFFNIIKNKLIEEYKKATEYVPSKEYSEKYDPDLMQRLCIIRLREKKYYANWSKTGTGKTLQSLLSSLDIDSKITLYILPNSTVSDKAGTKKKEGAIKEFIPDSNVIIYNGKTSLKSIIPGKRNYILVNYDKLSRSRFLNGLEDLARERKIDFICVDEVQMAKSRGDRAASNRNKALLALRRLAEDYNPNLYVLGLTATPVINNLYEIKTLCEIVTGKSLGDDNLFNGNSISFAAAQTAHKYLVNYGFRYNYDYSKEITENEIILPIRGGKDLYNRINEINKKFKDLGKSRRGMAGIKELEDSQIILKLEACKHLIKPGVVIYTQYVGGEKENNTITIINRWLRQNGLESVLYTGQMNDLTEDEETGEQIKIRDEELQRFIGDPEKGIIGTNKTKVLIASSVLRTGVDGLQKVSNKIIMLSLPWTYADYEQLKGRFIRRNSNFNEVNIYIPIVSLKLTTGEWSWDKSKLEILQYKKDLSDLIIYGNYCDSNILRIAQTETERSLIEKALSQIDAPLEIYSEEIHPDIDYHEVKRRLGNPKPYRRPKGSCIIHIHKRYDTMDTVEIESDMAAPERRGSMTDYWIDQDSIVRKSGYVDPNTETSYLIQDIYGGLDKKVADLGCGPHDPLRKLVTNCEEFFSCTFEPEEVTLPLDVVRCDSTRLNMVENKYFDIVNHTNSHWGTNLNDYVLEDYRILKDDGVLIITSVCPPRRNKYKIIANAYLESGLWEYLVEPIRFGGKSGMTRGIFKKKGI